MDEVLILLVGIWCGIRLDRRYPLVFRWWLVWDMWLAWKHRKNPERAIRYSREVRLMAMPSTPEKETMMARNRPRIPRTGAENDRYMEELVERERWFKHVPDDKLGDV